MYAKGLHAEREANAAHSLPFFRFLLFTLFRSPASARLEQMEACDQAGEHDGDHREELDEDVDGRAGGILERIAHSITDNGSLMPCLLYTSRCV